MWRDAVLGVVISLALALVGFAINAVRSDRLPIFGPQRAGSVGELGNASPKVELPTGLTEAQFADVEEAVRSDSALLVDARPELFFNSGHIGNAISLPRSSFAASYSRSRDAFADKGRPVIVYCQGGTCVDSVEVAGQLRVSGLKNVRVYLGGWNEWNRRANHRK